jgi:hypothetical protein
MKRSSPSCCSLGVPPECASHQNPAMRMNLFPYKLPDRLARHETHMCNLYLPNCLQHSTPPATSTTASCGPCCTNRPQSSHCLAPEQCPVDLQWLTRAEIWWKARSQSTHSSLGAAFSACKVPEGRVGSEKLVCGSWNAGGCRGLDR